MGWVTGVQGSKEALLPYCAASHGPSHITSLDSLAMHKPLPTPLPCIYPLAQKAREAEGAAGSHQKQHRAQHHPQLDHTQSNNTEPNWQLQSTQGNNREHLRDRSVQCSVNPNHTHFF